MKRDSPKKSFITNVILTIRLILVLVITFYFTIRALITTVLLKNPKGFHRLARKWSVALLRCCKIHIETIYNERLPSEKAFIFVSNHSSLIDIPVLTWAVGRDIRIIYKEELEKVPIFGWMLAASPYISIKRSDARNSMSGINDAVESIKEGDSVVIFPEGTRSIDGRLQNFKRGAFLLASRSGMPIVPVSVIGTFELLPPNTKSIRSGNVKVIFDSPVYIESGNRMDEKKLMYEVYETISRNIESNK